MDHAYFLAPCLLPVSEKEEINEGERRIPLSLLYKSRFQKEGKKEQENEKEKEEEIPPKFHTPFTLCKGMRTK